MMYWRCKTWMLNRIGGVQSLYQSKSKLIRGFTQTSLCASFSSWLYPKGWTQRQNLSMRKEHFSNLTLLLRHMTPFFYSKISSCFFNFYQTYSVSFYLFFFCQQCVPSLNLLEELSSLALHWSCSVCLAKTLRTSAFACLGEDSRIIAVCTEHHEREYRAFSRAYHSLVLLCKLVLCLRYIFNIHPHFRPPLQHHFVHHLHLNPHFFASILLFSLLSYQPHINLRVHISSHSFRTPTLLSPFSYCFPYQ